MLRRRPGRQPAGLTRQPAGGGRICGSAMVVIGESPAAGLRGDFGGHSLRDKAAYQAVEPVGVPSTTAGGTIYVWLSRHVPSWLGKGTLIAVMMGGTAFVACWIAWRHSIAANMAAVAGIAAVAVLTWATQWCNAVGGIIVGAVVAGMIIAVAMVARVQCERGILKTLDGWWSRPASLGTDIGMVRFAQISLGLYFGTIALMAATGLVLTESRWEVLTLSGVGITAASVISEKRRLTNALPLIGVGIAWWVSYIEMGRAVAMDDAGINAADLILAAGIIIYLPVTALALRARQAVRILIAPMLFAGLATCATFLAVGIIAVVIFTGCNAADALIATLLLAAVVISIIVGAVTFLVLFAMGIVDWRRNRKDPATPSGKE